MGIPEADAEELACETLFTVSSRIHTFQHGGRAKLTTWIFEIAKNKAIDFHRKQESQPEEVALADGFPHCASAGACAGRNAPYLSWLREQFAKMEESDRELLLWRAADIPYEQIAGWMADVLRHPGGGQRRTRIAAAVLSLCAEYPLPS